MLKIAIHCLIVFSSLSAFAKEYQVAFYSDFEPISYSRNRDASSPEFNEPQGYEIDLLKAIESIPESRMTFRYHGVKAWDNIWLSPHTDPTIDIAVGGITYEKRRVLDKDGKHVVAATHKTLNFKQSLLMRTKDTLGITTHADLTCAFVVGAVRGTTGETRFLTQSGIMQDLDQGLLKKGISVILDDKKFITSDGTLSIYDPKIKNRLMLIPPDCTSPVTKYFVAEDTMIPALKEGHIDAIARGYIGNKLVADKANGEFVVNAIFSLECPKNEVTTCDKKEEAVFFVKHGNQNLLKKLNRYIDELTDHGKIDYETWRLNKKIFMERARFVR